MSKKPTKKKVLINHNLEKKYSFGIFKIEEGDRISVSFDFSKASVPKETYSASYAFLKVGSNLHDVFIIFVQIDAINGTVKHNLQVKLDDLSIINAWANSKDFYKRVENWYRQTYDNEPKKEIVEISSNTPSYQVASNLVFFGHQENSAIVAFYYFDPRAARDIMMGRNPNEDLVGVPIVQVKMNTLTVWCLLDDIKNYIDDILSKYPKFKNRMSNAKEIE